jgi:hypothetical protein
MPDPAIAAEPVSLPAIAEPAEPMSLPAIAEPADPMSDPAVADPAPSVCVFFFLHPATARDKANKVIAMRMRYPPARMLRGFRLSFIFAVALLRPAMAGDDLRMPPGTRKDTSGTLVSGRGLRATTDFLARELVRRGITVTQIGPTRIRGAELTRFLSQSPATPWLAIHVLRTAGKTLIFFVPRQALDEGAATR